jgi:hypothetical protein
MKHLSPEQVSSIVAGIDASTGELEIAHVRECAACALEVDRMKAVLMQFRGSVRTWSEKSNHSEFPVREAIASNVRGTYARRRGSVAWVLATAALAAVVVIPAYEESRSQALKAQAQRDDQLLMDVNAHLSRSGPIAMDPLMKMMGMPRTPDFPDGDWGAEQEDRGSRGRSRGNGGEK